MWATNKNLITELTTCKSGFRSSSLFQTDSNLDIKVFYDTLLTLRRNKRIFGINNSRKSAKRFMTDQSMVVKTGAPSTIWLPALESAVFHLEKKFQIQSKDANFSNKKKAA